MESLLGKKSNFILYNRSVKINITQYLQFIHYNYLCLNKIKENIKKNINKKEKMSATYFCMATLACRQKSMLATFGMLQHIMMEMIVV